MELKTTEEYEDAKKEFAKLFHEDPCRTDFLKSQELLKALDIYESQHKKES